MVQPKALYILRVSCAGASLSQWKKNERQSLTGI